MTSSSRQRWDELLDSLAGLLPAGPAAVLVDGAGDSVDRIEVTRQRQQATAAAIALARLER